MCDEMCEELDQARQLTRVFFAQFGGLLMLDTQREQQRRRDEIAYVHAQARHVPHHMPHAHATCTCHMH